MPFTIPDKGEGLHNNQSILFQEYLDVLVTGVSGADCVRSGCAVTAQATPNMTVAVAAGTVVTNSVTLTVVGANATIAAADATNPRFDLVLITAAGALVVRAGTAAAAPKPAARVANDVVLAVVYVPAGDLAIEANQIVDLRVVVPQIITADIANDAITYAKLQNVSATDRLLGRVTAGAGDAEEIVCTPFARTLLDDADAVTTRATLGGALIAANILGPHTVGVPAGAMSPRLTAGAVTSTIALATNATLVTSHNYDPTAENFAQFTIAAPKSFNSAIALTGVFEWSHPATTVNFAVAWAVRAKYIGDNVAIDSVWSAFVQVLDTGGVTDNLYVSPVTAGITPAGTYVENCSIMFEVKRTAADAADTLAVVARLHRFAFKYSTLALNDA